MAGIRFPTVYYLDTDYRDSTDDPIEPPLFIASDVRHNFRQTRMEYTKDNIITEYKKLKEHLGKPPSSRTFEKDTGIPLRILEKLFGRNSWTKLVTECGDTPNDFSSPKVELEEILFQWATLAKNSGTLPVIADWRFHNCKPSIGNIKSSHDLTWGDLPYKFLELYSDKDEWKDVITLIPNRSTNGYSVSKSIPKIDGLNFELLKFIPPIVQDLVEQSLNEEKARDFEKNVNLVFQMLGFDVTDYGQGTGRNPDGVAKENQHRYAILIDAKSRGDNYKIGTEDRKFIEYIKTFSEPLRKQGFTNIYFLVVSSRFDTVSLTAIKNIKVATQVTTTLLTSRQLLKILSTKIQTPRLFDLKKFQELLIEDGEITDKKIDKFIAGQK
ncbi:MAG: restriction endonuclease FokI C-terminal domain-containing protein [Saprospiraceae bacterium]